MSSMVGHKEVAIKPEHVVVSASSSGYYPAKSEEVETDNEEDTNTQKMNIIQHTHQHQRHTEDDDVSTDDEGIINNNKSTVELKSPRFDDTRQ